MMASTLPHNNKTFRFDSALDWEQEDRKTANGVEVRRERKQRKKQRKMNQEEQRRRPGQTFAFLQDRGRHEDVIGVCEANFAFRFNLIGFLTYVTDIGGLLEDQLITFRDPDRGFHLQGLDESAMQLLVTLTGIHAFARVFFPPAIISASSSDSDAAADNNDKEQVALI
jgi:hypothetical protein